MENIRSVLVGILVDFCLNVLRELGIFVELVSNIRQDKFIRFFSGIFLAIFRHKIFDQRAGLLNVADIEESSGVIKSYVFVVFGSRAGNLVDLNRVA